MPKMTGKRALMEQLVADDVRYVFGNPGTTEQGFLDILQDYPQIQFMLALHEGVAVGMADAYARATRRPAFVEVHTGPGLGNALGMIYNASVGKTPMVVYAGHSPSRSVLQEPLLSGPLVDMARPLCKWAAEIHHAHDVPRALRRAFKTAMEPPCGPVFLSLPLDTLDEEAEVEIVPTTYTHWRGRVDPAAMEDVARRLLAAEHPMVMVGDNVAVADAQPEAAAVAEALGAPIFECYASEFNVSARHPAVRGQRQLRHPGARARGPRELRRPARGRGAALPADLPRARHDAVARGHHGHPDRPRRLGAGQEHHPGHGRARRSRRLRSPSWPSRFAGCARRPRRAWPRSAPRAIGERTQGPARPLLGGREEELGRRAHQRPAPHARDPPRDPGRRHGVRRGHHQLRRTWPRPWRPTEPGRLMRARGGGIGPGLPGTLGAQLARPGTKVVGVCSDGAAMYSITALWTAAHHRIPATFVMLNNAAYRILKLNMLEYLGPAARGRQFVAMDLTDPELRFDRMAESMGVPGRRVERPDDLAPALQEALAHDGPSLVDVVMESPLPGR